MINFKESRGGVIFEVLLQPGASRNEITGIHDDCLKLKVTSMPVKGKANRACIDYIARGLGLKRNDVEIISGHTARKKKLCVRGITINEFIDRLDHLIE